MTPKRHHYVPQLILRRHADDEGYLHVFRKSVPEKGVLKQRPDQVFLEGHLYSRIKPDGTKDPKLEESLSRLEHEADAVVEKIVVAARKGKGPQLTVAERTSWDEFVYLQWKRVPGTFEKYADSFDADVSRSISEFEKQVRPLSLIERAHLETPESRKRIWHNAKVSAVAQPSPMVLDLLSQRGIGVAVLENPKRSFIVGSTPIVKLSHPGRGVITDPSVEVWFPIASDVAVTPWGGQRMERVVVLDDANHIRSLNQSILDNSDAVAGRSASLINSLVKHLAV